MQISSANQKKILEYARHGNFEQLQYLINTQPKLNLEIQNEKGQTSLMLATRYNHYDCVKLLLKHNANQEHTNYYGKDATYFSCRLGHIKILKLLLKYRFFKTKQIQEKHFESLKRLNKFGDNALLAASRHGHFECLKLLLTYFDKEQNLFYNMRINEKRKDQRNHILYSFCDRKSSEKEILGFNAFQLAYKNSHFDCLNFIINFEREKMRVGLDYTSMQIPEIKSLILDFVVENKGFNTIQSDVGENENSAYLKLPYSFVEEVYLQESNKKVVREDKQIDKRLKYSADFSHCVRRPLQLRNKTDVDNLSASLHQRRYRIINKNIQKILEREKRRLSYRIFRNKCVRNTNISNYSLINSKPCITIRKRLSNSRQVKKTLKNPNNKNFNKNSHKHLTLE